MSDARVLLTEVRHRPWGLPQGTPVMAQTWQSLLFAHWPVSADELRQVMPSQLSPDLYEGEAWVGVVPFGMSRVRLRGIPALPWLSAFPELNVRTYVTVGGKPGVYFFSLDAGNPVAVRVARRWYNLPYFQARMSLRAAGGWTYYSSQRTHPHAPAAALVARYRPVSDVLYAAPGTLEHWLTERYCLYTVDGRGRVYRGEVHHAPWPLRRAEAEIARNTMTASHGIRVPGTPPLLHYAERLDVLAWSPRRVG